LSPLRDHCPARHLERRRDDRDRSPRPRREMPARRAPTRPCRSSSGCCLRARNHGASRRATDHGHLNAQIPQHRLQVLGDAIRFAVARPNARDGHEPGPELPQCAGVTVPETPFVSAVQTSVQTVVECSVRSPSTPCGSRDSTVVCTVVASRSLTAIVTANEAHIGGTRRTSANSSVQTGGGDGRLRLSANIGFAA
jgi:hypothetical protein